jgi:hypothetical protein
MQDTPLSRLGLEPPKPDPKPGLRLLVHFTRNWIHYGWLGLTVLLCIVAAVQGLLAR